MDGRDNIFIERLWRSVKQEKLYGYSFETIEEVEMALSEYFDYYKNRRPHQSLGYITPANMYFGHNQKTL